MIDTTGYWGIFILSAIESAGIPIPSEVVVPFSGFLAAQGRFTILMIALTATVANLAGSLILYGIGRKGGRWILERYGKYVFIHHADLERGDEWFARHGVKAVFFGRLLPVIRTFISLPAGVAKMPITAFIIYTLLGAFPWNLGLAYIGYALGERWDILHTYFQKFDIVIVVVIVLAGVWYIVHHIRKGHLKAS